MQPNDILLLGLKRSVSAISRASGQIIWSTELPDAKGHFITLLADKRHVFAYSQGHLYALDLGTGRLLWRNPLPGLGFGLGALAIPGETANSPVAAMQQQTEAASVAAIAASTTIAASS